MRIRHIQISNFRGIKELEWGIPNEKLVCLIGRGDCGKTSILDAIRLALYPSWNPTFSEFDFFDGKTDIPLTITVTLGNLASGVLKLQKYGQHLRGWSAKDSKLHDEPGDGLEEVFSIRLSVDESLEPKWTAYRPQDGEGPPVTAHDRANIGAAYLGTYADRHLTWSKYSALSRITQSSNISSSLMAALRSAKKALASSPDKLAEFSHAASEVEEIAKKLAVPVSTNGAFRPQIDSASVNMQVGGLALHDGDIPLRRLGLGSRRILTLGIQQHGQTSPSISLIDELELGLEPHRVARTVQFLSQEDRGQTLLTTHSPVVLRELAVEQLFVVRKTENGVEIRSAAVNELQDVVQGKIRKGAEAILAEKIIVCEGATEVGFCRALDRHWQTSGAEPISFVGATTLDSGGGANVKTTAIAAHSLGYDVAAIVDSDSDENFSADDKTELVNKGIHVVFWDGGLSIEEFFLRWLPWTTVIATVQLALLDPAIESGVVDAVKGRMNGTDLGDDVAAWNDSEELRIAIGTAASKKNWFKRLDKGEKWASTIFDMAPDLPDEIETKLSELKSWVHDDNT